MILEMDIYKGKALYILKCFEINEFKLDMADDVEYKSLNEDVAIRVSGRDAIDYLLNIIDNDFEEWE